MNLPVEPAVDGNQDSQYRFAAKIPVFDSDNVTGKPGEVHVLLSQASSSMFLTLRAQSKSDELGGEQGQLTLYIDSDHLKIVEGFTCGTVAPAPDDHDRRITIAYQSGPQQASGATTVTQAIGTCANGPDPWRPANSSEHWDVSAASVESSEDPGFIHIEVKIGMGATTAVNEGMFGMGMIAETKPTVVYRLPLSDNSPPAGNDVSSWEKCALGALFARSSSREQCRNRWATEVLKPVS